MVVSSFKEDTMKKVFFQGAFDLINWGHIKAFKDAKLQGDYLIVGLNTDELIRQYKNREPILPFYQRKEILEAIRYIDEVIPANEFSPLQMLIDLDIDVYVIGEEWKGTKVKEINFMKSKGGEVFFTPTYPGVIRSTEIRRKCANGEGVLD